MERPRLTPQQAGALRERIRRMLHFLHRCRRRLEVLGFDEKGEIFQEIDKVHSAMHSLHVTLIYESCGHGVWKPSDEQPGVTHPTDQAQAPPNHQGT